MKFGQTIRSLREAKKLGQRELADRVGLSFSYISKIENERLDFGEFPPEPTILKLADALGADPDALLLLAGKVPEKIRVRVLERPAAFLRLAGVDDETLDQLLRTLDRRARKPRKRPVKTLARQGAADSAPHQPVG